MSRIESYTPGAFCWAELATSDVPAAKTFYGEIFGWTSVDMPTPNGVYTIFQAEGKDVAAVYPAFPGVPNNWGVYFATENVDESAARIASLGGKAVMGPMDVGDSGRMVVAQDPEGVHFSLWQARKHIGATHGGPFGRAMWPELSSADPVSAARFYTGLLGWKTKPETGLDTVQYAEWVLEGASFGGLMAMRGDEWKGIPPHWLIYITVADCDERAARVTSLGGSVRVPPTDIPNVGRFSLVGDPQGAMFSLIQMKAMHSPAAV